MSTDPGRAQGAPPLWAIWYLILLGVIDSGRGARHPVSATHSYERGTDRSAGRTESLRCLEISPHNLLSWDPDSLWNLVTVYT